MKRYGKIEEKQLNYQSEVVVRLMFFPILAPSNQSQTRESKRESKKDLQIEPWKIYD